MSVVMRRLNAAPRSRGELRTYLLGKEFESKEIDTVLDRVESMGYIDDAQYALDWVRSRHRARMFAQPEAQRLPYPLPLTSRGESG